MPLPPIDDFIIETALTSSLIRIYDNNETKKPFKWISSFHTTANRSVHSLKEANDTIVAYFSEEKLNFAIIILDTGFVILSEEELKVDKLIMKLSTGFNFNKQAKYNLNNKIKKLFTNKDFLEKLKSKNIMR